MDVDITYPEMAYIRQLLQKDNPKKDSIDEDVRIDLLDKIQGLEEDYAAGLIS